MNFKAKRLSKQGPNVLKVLRKKWKFEQIRYNI